MCRKLVFLVSLALVFSAAGSASADLILHWAFDDGSGGTAVDRSGNGHNGTLEGDPKWVAGRIGGALEFGGDGDRVVDDDGASYLNGLEAMTVAVWIKSNRVGTDAGFIQGEDPDGGDNVCTIRYDSSGASFGGSNVMKMAVTADGEQQLESSSGTQVTEWQHIAMTWESGGLIRLYINGEEDTPSGRNGPNTAGVQSGVMKFIVGQGAKDAGGGWDGLIDDVRIYDEAMSAERIQGVMVGEGFPFSLGPDPEDGALHADTWVNLSWSAGDFAVSHDVYFGNSFEDVNNGAGDTFRGNQADTFYIAGFPGFAFPDG
ncbi:MAG: LamG domain-containing protein, partial [Planctomycetota bacterium]